MKALRGKKREAKLGFLNESREGGMFESIQLVTVTLAFLPKIHLSSNFIYEYIQYEFLRSSTKSK